MKRHWQYLKYVLRHKWFVFQAGLMLGGIPVWMLILHDWDKFLPDEWLPYARAFYTPDGSKQYQPNRAFSEAWNLHQKRNKHHWQFWMITWDKGNTECLKMPEVYLREMLADWHGAGRAITGKANVSEWYKTNKNNIHLDAETRDCLESLIDKVDW